MLLFTNGAFALFMIIDGYKYMFGASKSFREFAPTLIVAAIMANFSLPVLGQLIEVSNTVCTGILGVLATTGIGDLKLPLGLIDWATAPEYLIIVYLIELVCVLLLCGQMLLLVAPQTGREQSLRRVAASAFGTLPLTVWTTTEMLVKVQGPLAAIWKPMRLGLSEEDVDRSIWVEQL